MCDGGGMHQHTKLIPSLSRPGFFFLLHRLVLGKLSRGSKFELMERWQVQQRVWTKGCALWRHFYSVFAASPSQLHGRWVWQYSAHRESSWHKALRLGIRHQPPLRIIHVPGTAFQCLMEFSAIEDRSTVASASIRGGCDSRLQKHLIEGISILLWVMR